jgi:hypothetical protein
MNIIPRAGELSFNVLDTASGEPALLFLHYWGGSQQINRQDRFHVRGCDVAKAHGLVGQSVPPD